MRILAIILTLMVSSELVAQPGIEALEKDNKTLQERYLVLKLKSQSFKDYKVIKESILDGMWVIIRDTLKINRAAIRVAKQDIKELQVRVDSIGQQLKKKEQSMEETVHASTHIGMLGIDFNKGTFKTIFGVIVISLLAALGVIITRMKMQNKTLSEKNLAVHSLTQEYEDYKHRAMEKQTKLSRELQDERNKLYGTRNS